MHFPNAAFRVALLAQYSLTGPATTYQDMSQSTQPINNLNQHSKPSHARHNKIAPREAAFSDTHNLPEPSISSILSCNTHLAVASVIGI